MKILSTLLVITFSFISWTQEDQIYKIEKNRIVFDQIIQKPGLNQEELFDSITSILENKFQSRFVIKNKTNDLISGTGTVNNTGFYKKDYNQLNFNFSIVIKDNRFKIKFEHLLISGLTGNSESIDNYLINNDGSLKTNGKAKRSGNELNKSLKRFLDEFNEALNIQQDALGDEDDW
jgi:hypothetical protein